MVVRPSDRSIHTTEETVVPSTSEPRIIVACIHCRGTERPAELADAFVAINDNPPELRSLRVERLGSTGVGVATHL